MRECDRKALAGWVVGGGRWGRKGSYEKPRCVRRGGNQSRL